MITSLHSLQSLFSQPEEWEVGSKERVLTFDAREDMAWCPPAALPHNTIDKLSFFYSKRAPTCSKKKEVLHEKNNVLTALIL